MTYETANEKEDNMEYVINVAAARCGEVRMIVQISSAKRKLITYGTPRALMIGGAVNT